MSNSRVAIQETYEIPSKGKIYTDMEVPSQITLRAMTTVEEKMRLSGQGLDVIPKLIKACIVEPDGLDVGKMKMFDIQYLMYKLRTVTYGSEYETEIRCPHCGTVKKITIDLDDIPVNYLDDDFPGLVIGPLPVSKDTIECRALSVDDYSNIAKEAKRIKSKFPGYVGDPEYILMLQNRILKINNETVKPNMIQKYVESMNMKDVRYLETKYDEILGNIGLDTEMIDTCDVCGEEINYQISTGPEFFRPTNFD